MIKVNVINRLGQEFTITGYIPKAYSIMQGVRTSNRSVLENRFMIRFADDQYSNIKIFYPNGNCTLTIKNITDLNDVFLYENKDYNIHKFDIDANIKHKYGDENFFTSSSAYFYTIQALLGKVVILKNQNIPDITDSKCLITHISVHNENLLQIKLVYGTNKTSILINVQDIKKHFIL